MTLGKERAMNSTLVLPPSLFKSFTRAQIAAALSTALDYGALFVLTEVFHAWYVLAIVVGAVIGAISNFLLNRVWSFQALHQKWSKQARRYMLVSVASLILNAGGVYWLTETFHFHYALSVFAVSTLVGIGFNFPLHRHYVYR